MTLLDPHEHSDSGGRKLRLFPCLRFMSIISVALIGRRLKVEISSSWYHPLCTWMAKFFSSVITTTSHIIYIIYIYHPNTPHNFLCHNIFKVCNMLNSIFLLILSCMWFVRIWGEIASVQFSSSLLFKVHCYAPLHCYCHQVQSKLEQNVGSELTINIHTINLQVFFNYTLASLVFLCFSWTCLKYFFGHLAIFSCLFPFYLHFWSPPLSD